MMIELSPETYEKYVLHEGNSKVLYVRINTKALTIWYVAVMTRNFGRILSQLDSRSILMIHAMQIALLNRKQHTVTWHVDDLTSSHLVSKVNDQFLELIKKKHASDEISEVNVMHGNKHD